MLAGLAAYADDEEEEEEEEDVAGGFNAAKHFAQVRDESDESGGDDDGEEQLSARAPQPAQSTLASGGGGHAISLPSADDILASTVGLAHIPDQLRPVQSLDEPGVVTHQHEYGRAGGRAAPTASEAPSREALPAAAAHEGGASTRPADALAAASKRVRAAGDKAQDSVKARTEKKRKAGQSAAFLGGQWKTETEMHFRDNFDS